MSWANSDDRWSTLLPGLLLPILTRMFRAADRVRFGSVCRWWRSVLTESRHLLPPTDPLLMLPYTEDNPHPRQLCSIRAHWVLLPDSQIDPTLQPAERNLMKSLRCQHRMKKVVFGSSMGWLFLDDYGVFGLWNSVTRAEIALPSPAAVPVLFKTVKKAALSSDPNSDDCVAVTIGESSGALSFCRVRDENWTVLGSNFEDAVFYRGRIYAVTRDGDVAACDVGPNPKLTWVVKHDYNPEDDIYGMHNLDSHDHWDWDGDLSFKNYLVESSGELLKVTRIVKSIVTGPDLDVRLTLKFVIHRLDDREEKWSKVESMGDRALFLGGSSSVSLAADEVHDGECRRNCIYFLDDYGFSDMGVFDLGDGSISTYGIHTYGCSIINFYCSKYVYAPHFWISLSPW